MTIPLPPHDWWAALLLVFAVRATIRPMDFESKRWTGTQWIAACFQTAVAATGFWGVWRMMR